MEPSLVYVISVPLGIVIAMKRASRYEIKKGIIVGLAVIILVALIVGNDVAGLPMIGTIALAILSSWIYAKIKKTKFVNLVDVITPLYFFHEGIARLFTSHWIASALGFIGFVSIIVLGRESSWGGFGPVEKRLNGKKVTEWDYMGHAAMYAGWTFFASIFYFTIYKFVIDQLHYSGTSKILATLGPVTFYKNHILLLVVFIVSGLILLIYWNKQKDEARYH